MSEQKPVRPSQVTVAGWLVVGGSTLMVLTALAQGAGLHSLQTRDAVEDYLAGPPGDQIGLGVEDTLTLLRVVWTVAAALAATTAVLGWFALQRSKGARLGMSLLALPIFVAGFFFVGVPGGGAVSAMVAAAIVMLWFQPARDWFAGVVRAAPSPPPLPAQTLQPPALPPAPPTGPPTGTGDPLRDLPPPSGPPVQAAPYVAPYASPYAAGPVPAPQVHQRPPAVSWACALTWIGCATTFVLMLVVVVGLASDPSLIEDARSQNSELVDAGVTDAVLRNGVYVLAAVVMLWSLGALVLSLLVWRRVRWAAIALAVSAGAASGLCLLSVISSIGFVVPLAVCAGAVALLLRPEARSWLGAGRS